jgi:crotonobetainyl-CoA:carnitine CoA-transferase CaiB-like acyl-CoA transferase
MGLPLDGIRVVDFTTAMAGPCCSMLLADFGADVLKVEPPGGEGARTWGASRFGEDGSFSALFVSMNRNKQSTVVDLKTEEGRPRAHALMRDADVVLESFKPGAAERLGVGYETARELRPDVVYCSISGFGQTGPLRERPGYDQLLQAYAGHMSVTGEPGRPSVRIGPSAIDLLTGAHAAYGIVLALRERDRTGAGQRVDTSLYDSSLHLVTHFIADYTGSGRVPGKEGGGFAFLAPYGMFQARDREFYMGVGTDRMFRALCEAIGRPALADHPRFASNPERVAHRDELDAELAPVFAGRDAATWIELCDDLGIPASLVSTIGEVVEQEQARAREMLVDTGIDGVRTAGIPVKLSETPGTVRRPPPRLGDADRAPVR